MDQVPAVEIFGSHYSHHKILIVRLLHERTFGYLNLHSNKNKGKCPTHVPAMAPHTQSDGEGRGGGGSVYCVLAAGCCAARCWDADCCVLLKYWLAALVAALLLSKRGGYLFITIYM
jgi:hypothetical protein